MKTKDFNHNSKKERRKTMEKYINAELEIVEFETEDVITTSCGSEMEDL